MYRKRPWTMRQYSGFGTAAETHERFLYLIKHGQTGLNVAFDLPTQCGLDSDDPMAEGEVGRVGMAVDTLADMEEAFDDIDLNKITVSLTINGAAAPIMAMYFAMARKRGFELATLRGTAQNDILKEFIGRGTWIFPVEPSIRLVGDTIEFCAAQRAAIQRGERLRLPHPRVGGQPGPGDGLRPGHRQGLHRPRAGARPGHRPRSPAGSPSTSTSTATSGSRWPSSAPAGGCGPRSSRSSTAPSTRARCSCA